MRFHEVIIMTRSYLHTYAGAHESHEVQNDEPVPELYEEESVQGASHSLCHRMRATQEKAGQGVTCTWLVLTGSTGLRSSMVGP